MADDVVAQFSEITGAAPERAAQYIRLSEGNIDQAIQLFFETGGVDLGGTEATPPFTAPPVQPSTQQQDHASPYGDDGEVVHVDSDDESTMLDYPPRPQIPGQSRPPANVTPPTGPSAPAVEDDEAMARRLQEEMYSESGAFGGSNPGDVRAPLARTTETLVGPGAEPYGEEDMHAAVMAQVRAREQGQRSSSRPGIFNQQPASSIWNDDGSESSGRRERLSRATGGASDASSKSNMLAEMYRPPFEIMSRMDFETGRDEGRSQEKWLLVNIQDPSVFDCQVLNRDLWKEPQVRDTVKENFVFLQYNKEDPRATQYIQYYFPHVDSQDSYPHIAIVDPRTGEQVKVWSGPPVPKPGDFLMQLHEFLDRYSLKQNARNPVAKRKPEVKKEKKIDMMSEEEMLEMALQNSLATEAANRQEDPDDLTRSVGDLGKGKQKVIDLDEDEEMQDIPPPATNGHAPSPTLPSTSPFQLIPSDQPHNEPPQDPATTTRIQFRHSGGRVIRRFLLTDPVRRIYEWLKASPLEGKEGVEFELVAMAKNLIDSLEDTIEGAGLKNGTVMIEFLED